VCVKKGLNVIKPENPVKLELGDVFGFSREVLILVMKPQFLLNCFIWIVPQHSQGYSVGSPTLLPGLMELYRFDIFMNLKNECSTSITYIGRFCNYFDVELWNVDRLPFYFRFY